MSRVGVAHPVFQDAHYTEQWQGTRCIGLWNLLNFGLDDVQAGVAVRRVVPSGIMFTLTRLADGHRVLAVAAPDTMSVRVWQDTLDTHLRGFGEPVTWMREVRPGVDREATFHEPAALL